MKLEQEREEVERELLLSVQRNTTKTLTISTGHVEKADMDLLEEGSLVSICSYPEGAYVNIIGGQDYEDGEVKKILKDGGFSKSFQELYILCVDYNITTLRLDGAYPCIPELPIHEW